MQEDRRTRTGSLIELEAGDLATKEGAEKTLSKMEASGNKLTVGQRRNAQFDPVTEGTAVLKILVLERSFSILTKKK